jgi:hypothetical protein
VHSPDPLSTRQKPQKPQNGRGFQQFLRRVPSCECEPVWAVLSPSVVESSHRGIVLGAAPSRPTPHGVTVDFYLRPLDPQCRVRCPWTSSGIPSEQFRASFRISADTREHAQIECRCYPRCYPLLSAPAARASNETPTCTTQISMTTDPRQARGLLTTNSGQNTYIAVLRPTP